MTQQDAPALIRSAISLHMSKPGRQQPSVSLSSVEEIASCTYVILRNQYETLAAYAVKLRDGKRPRLKRRQTLPSQAGAGDARREPDESTS